MRPRCHCVSRCVVGLGHQLWPLFIAAGVASAGCLLAVQLCGLRVEFCVQIHFKPRVAGYVRRFMKYVLFSIREKLDIHG